MLWLTTSACNSTYRESCARVTNGEAIHSKAKILINFFIVVFYIFSLLKGFTLAKSAEIARIIRPIPQMAQSLSWISRYSVIKPCTTHLMIIHWAI